MLLCSSGSCLNIWKPNVKPFSVQATRQQLPVHVTQRQRFEWRQHAPSAWWNWQAGWSTARLVGRPGAVRDTARSFPRRLSPPCHCVTSHVSPTARATHTTLSLLSHCTCSRTFRRWVTTAERERQRGAGDGGREERNLFVTRLSLTKQKTKNKMSQGSLAVCLFAQCMFSFIAFFFFSFFVVFVCSLHAFYYCRCSYFLGLFNFVVLFLSCLRSSVLNPRWSKRSKLRGCLLPPP